MPARSRSRRDRESCWREWGMAATPVVALSWLAAVLVLVVKDQPALIPPRPPPPVPAAAATPAARAHWKRFYLQLQERLEPWQLRPPELGAVWSTRTGAICGLVDQWRTSLDYMTRFYTVGDRVRLRDDDLGLYVRSWSRCMMDPYVVLHPGSDAEGLCASATGRRDWGRYCPGERRTLQP